MAAQLPPTHVAASFPLPHVLAHAAIAPTLLAQGAEGRLYKTNHLHPSRPAALKYRPSKPYRHPILDARLTRARILAEARILYRCRREAVPVPLVFALDEAAGWLLLEWISGDPVRVAINTWLAQKHPTASSRPRAAVAQKVASLGSRISEEQEDDDSTHQQKQQQQGDVPKHQVRENTNQDDKGTTGKWSDEETENGGEARRRIREDAPLKALMRNVGTVVGKLHRAGIVHGDLTTSNMMLRPPPTADSGIETAETATDSGAKASLDGDIVLIDFGLSSQSSSDEDRAVDLYVLERAFGSTHPRAEVLFPEVLEGYRGALPAKQATSVLRKLEDVRMRGRKRSMVG
ncbi:hypothetical protein SODALDRAFT_328635 [Sodiomyces alkalinus F11]|uniref:EKC/KEOPS complex subunit BUD32 n=1 Tax=Sodiomyces alkalinus (strain CBS 110278 / VKM F-3762 / F11) TaxID=1314773 RepID=A0A3N2PLN7_SODAK|nr:hypothetical protein SODALDRAFT_328635 [Sodiomyces alkalinus F11]ROT35314.1 hypothetical protein SODALDRAFT_328635 [Sodiomyces alkalinus F11]